MKNQNKGKQRTSTSPKKMRFSKKSSLFFFIFFTVCKRFSLVLLHPVEEAFQDLSQLVHCCHVDRRLHQGHYATSLRTEKKISLKACFRKWEVNLLLEVPLRVVRPSWCRDCKCDNLQPCGLLGWRVKDCPAGLALPRTHSWRSTSWRWPARWRCRCWRCTQSWKTLQPAKWLAIR